MTSTESRQRYEYDSRAVIGSCRGQQLEHLTAENEGYGFEPRSDRRLNNNSVCPEVNGGRGVGVGWERVVKGSERRRLSPTI